LIIGVKIFSALLPTSRITSFFLTSLIFLFIMVIFPLLYSFRLSFFSWNLLRFTIPPKFIGIRNYATLFTDWRVLNSLKLSLYFIVGSVSLELILGLGLALLSVRNLRGESIYRTTLLIPLMIAPVVAGFTWLFMFHSDFGCIPQILNFLGFKTLASLPILGDRNLVLPAIIFVDVWKSTPFVTLVMTAGLLSIPSEPYEAALVDGASRLQIFRYITLPLLRPVILVALLIRTIHNISFFDIPFIMTGGGPGTSSELLPLYNYTVAFNNFNMGYGAAISFLVLAVSAVFSIAYMCIFFKK